MSVTEAGTKTMTVLDRRVPGAPSALPEHLSRWGINLRLRFVVIAEIIAAAIIIAATRSLWWTPILIAVLVVAAVTITYSDTTAAGWIGRAARFWWYRRSASARARRAVIGEPFTVELPGIGPVGMRWDGRFVVTMIAVHGRPFAPTVLVPAGADTVNTVPLEVIAGLLYQFAGLELECVDVVSVSRRVAGDGRFTPKHDEVVGDRPAVGERSSWLVLRLCPQACLAAMAYRGDAAAAAAAATERIRQAVLRSGCRAVSCTKAQMREATEALLVGADLGRVEEAWDHLDVNADYVTAYRVAGSDLTTKFLNDVATVRSERTVAMIRLTADGAGRVSVGAVVRFHTAAPFTHPPLLALRPVSGQAFDSLVATLPLGDRALRMKLSTRRLDGADLKVPVGPSGLMFGMSVTGFPFLMPVRDGLRPVRMGIDAHPAVVIPLLLRASATGAVILIHTDRPGLWEPLRDNQRIFLAGDADPVRKPTMIVVDKAGQEIAGGERGHTVVILSETPSPDCDITVTQVGADEITVSTPTMRGVRLAIMRPRNEAQFLAHLRAATP